MPKTGRRGDFSHFCPCRAFGLTSILTQHTRKSVALNHIAFDSRLLKQCVDYGFTSTQISVNIFLPSGKKIITEVF